MFNKKIFAAFIILLLLGGVFVPTFIPNNTVKAETPTEEVGEFSNHFDYYDVLIATALQSKNSPYQIDAYPTQIIPLYDIDDNIIAYDITMSDGSYMVINANRSNPIAIEFAKSRAESLDKEKKYYYIAPSLVLKNDTKNTAILKINDTVEVSKNNIQLRKIQNDFKTILSLENRERAIQHSIIKEAVVSQSFGNNLTGDVYNNIIIWRHSLPVGSRVEKIINKSEYLNFGGYYGNTRSFENIPNVDNHCAATSAFNMVVYYKHIMGEPISNNLENKQTLFKAIHKYIKNGPVVASAYRKRLKKYLDKETTYAYSIVKLEKSWTKYKNEIDNDRMVLLFLLPDIFNGHFVNGVGTLIYDNGTSYFVVRDNWVFDNRYMLFGPYINSISRIHIYR